MVTEEVREKIVGMALRRSANLVLPEAREAVINEFCLPLCGREPDKVFCPAALRTFYLVFNAAVNFHSEQN